MLIILFIVAGAIMGIHSGIRYTGGMLRLLEVLVVNFFVIRLLIAVSNNVLFSEAIATNSTTRAVAFLCAFALARWLARRAVMRTDETVSEETYWESN